MREDTDAYTAECNRIKSELVKLDEKQVNLEKERTEIAKKAEEVTGDTETLAQLKIETEQVAEAKRQNDRLIKQTEKRLMEVEKVISMQIDSDIV